MRRSARFSTACDGVDSTCLRLLLLVALLTALSAIVACGSATEGSSDPYAAVSASEMETALASDINAYTGQLIAVTGTVADAWRKGEPLVDAGEIATSQTHDQDCILVNVGSVLVYAWEPPSTDFSKGSTVEVQGKCTGGKHVDTLGDSISLVDVSVRQL